MDRRFDSFVIFAEMRTGSNLLEATLAQVPGIACHGEIFNPDHLGGPAVAEVLGVTMADRIANPSVLLDRVRTAPGLNGFRFFFDHEPRVLDAILTDPRCAKIVLTRNPVDCYISLKIAYNTKRWRLTDVIDRIVWKPPFKPAEFEAFLAERQAFQVRLLNALQVSGQTAFYLDYEDSLRVDVVNGLLAHLGLDDRVEAISADLVRQNPEEMADKVRNFPEMEDALARIDWASLARTPNFEPRRAPGIPRAVAAKGAPLIYLPLPPFRDAHVRAWLAALGTGWLEEGFTQKTLRQWKRGATGHRSFTVLRHPLLRVHDAFAAVLMTEEHADLRRRLRAHYAVPIPADGGADGMTPAEWRAAFAAFLGFVKVNLAGQTGLRQEAIWGTQWSLVAGLAGFVAPDLLVREDRLAEDLGYLADTVGIAALPPPAAPADPAPVPLDAIHDRDLDALVRDIYRRDFLSFGFGAWKAPKRVRRPDSTAPR
ncbi:MAG: sulfotransferase [Albidovulum sp.]|uniref:nodulation protein NodH n=1 Tax=Albidovulum sp. TaxID=1872424 RepID=UPI00132492E9|nr:nodulation protein NodH [Defluviimonas sp.]KAB2887001.1 MAG: sulfotransferase [Defluviimonas sp.]